MLHSEVSGRYGHEGCTIIGDLILVKMYHDTLGVLLFMGQIDNNKVFKNTQQKK